MRNIEMIVRAQRLLGNTTRFGWTFSVVFPKHSLGPNNVHMSLAVVREGELSMTLLKPSVHQTK